MRDPLVSTYEALAAAMVKVHGKDFPVLDGDPDPTVFKKQLPAAHIVQVSGTVEKALMREYEPHGLINNGDGTYTVGTESCRFDYLIQVSFYGAKPGIAQRLSTAFMAYVEMDNELVIPGDKWGESMQIFLEAPPMPPRGEPDLYQCDATYRCRGKLITEERVQSIDVSKLKFKIE
ncbi:hypothetical protein [Paenibacillus tyrfis]|uniref:hypothetical protein n=1 Tax=Paenibacillus tyrfis TaxID=1501230 RepID=UPI00209EF4F9|nr:hypothetical protein [Paenibacillus tyrfis]MCP1306487.1 hypothetical protein [Paenibacillus tyrfis]